MPLGDLSNPNNVELFFLFMPYCEYLTSYFTTITESLKESKHLVTKRTWQQIVVVE
jgi:hypothetical protein